MLQVLKIQNLAIIDSAEIHFQSGLNIISGETGAGKSIVIQAISLLLGGRSHAELIRAGCDHARVEGLIDISEMPHVQKKLLEAGFEAGSEELLIKRALHRNGKHKILINGELATLSILQSVCDGLIDLCGQHEHQSLLRSSVQLELLDRYGGLTDLVKKIHDQWLHYRSLYKKLVSHQKQNNEQEKRSDFLKFQIHEIREANLVPFEDEHLQKEKHLLQSAEGRAQLMSSVQSILEPQYSENLNSSENFGILGMLQSALQKIRILQTMQSQNNVHENPTDKIYKMVESLERAIAEVEEVSLEAHRYLQTIELNSEKLQNTQDRLSLIAQLKKKYGATISDILNSFEQLENELASLNDLGNQIEKIQTELLTLEKSLNLQGAELSSKRKEIAKVLGSSVTGELKDLKMSEAFFSVEITTAQELSEWNGGSPDQIQFMIQTNAGEATRPIGKIASGGELSRLMLSIRRVIADRGGIGVYLFDEIDAGMGGQTAFQVGKKLKSVAHYNQVICITHLPQVASFADHHLVVKKSSSENRTLTEIIELSHDDRKSEIARMLGGPALTVKSLESAAELLDLAHR